MGALIHATGAASAAPAFPATAATPLAAPEASGKLSPSQVATFTMCQARWAYRYIEQLPDPPSSSLALGSSAHDAIGASMAQKIGTRRDLPAVEVVELFRTSWRSRLDEVCFTDDESPRDIEDAGAALVQKYMEDAAPWIQPAAVELPVEGVIGGVRVRGRIDLLDVDGRIVDLKSSKRSMTSISPDHLFQLATYAQCGPEMPAPGLPKVTGEARLDVMVKTKTPKLQQINQTITDAAKRYTQNVYPLAQEAMRTGVYLPNRGNNLCSRKNCAFWRACEKEFGGTVEDV